MTESEKAIFNAMDIEEKIAVMKTLPSEILFRELEKRQIEAEKKLSAICKLIDGGFLDEAAEKAKA